METDLIKKIHDLLENHFTDATVKIEDMTGTRDHLDILIVSDDFAGKRLIQQHQMVMNVLKNEFEQQLHAVKLKTLTKEQYKS